MSGMNIQVTKLTLLRWTWNPTRIVERHSLILSRSLYLHRSTFRSKTTSSTSIAAAAAAATLSQFDLPEPRKSEPSRMTENDIRKDKLQIYRVVSAFVFGILGTAACAHMAEATTSSWARESDTECNKISKQEVNRKYREVFLDQISEYLKSGYVPEGREGENQSLEFDPMKQEERKQILRAFMGVDKTGSLKLLEGSSGCGKTTAVQAALAGCSGAYMSVRRHHRVRHVSDLFEELTARLGASVADIVYADDFDESLWPSIIEAALRRYQGQSFSNKPVLIVDDVECIIDTEAGESFLAWCLEATSIGLLSVLFVSSSQPTFLQMQRKSGFRSRLMGMEFKPVPDDELKSALMSMKTMPFAASEAHKTVETIGSHLGDVQRLLQELGCQGATEQQVSIDEALQKLLDMEVRSLSSILDLEVHSLQAMVRTQILEQLMSQPRSSTLRMTEQRQCIKENRGFTMAQINAAVEFLTSANVISRPWHGAHESICFRRPLQHTAVTVLFNRVQKEAEQA